MKQPLAFRMRPKHLDDIVGQNHLIGKHQILRRCIEEKQLFSMIFYGPPGTGKTTLASVLANELGLKYRMFNAVSGNKKDLEIIFEEAKFFPGLVVIIDEVHRLNKDKQDLLLPHIENGAISLIGATTANPFHSINPAIRSRCHLFEVKSNTNEDIIKALHRSLVSDEGLANQYQISEAALTIIAQHSCGDIRYAMNILEICALACTHNNITLEDVKTYSQQPNLAIDKDGDDYYDTLSAFQKSIRGSDVDAALFYLAVLIEANDMASIERRLLVCAYEDIGLGNPQAVARVISAIDAAKRVGFPEGRIPLSVAIIDLCLSPKSKSAESAIDRITPLLKNQVFRVPEYLRLTPIHMDEDKKYDYTRSDLWNKIQYLPDALRNQTFYIPAFNSQYEQVLASNLENLKKHKRSNDLRLLKQKYPKK
ncbi:MAG: replication-associated recombination protein A [Breznakia sp.]